MNTKLTRLTIAPLLAVLGWSAAAQGTAFTYQGRLDTGSAPANGNYDFRFRLAADSLGSTLVGGPFLTNGIAVSNGLFTTVLDFGGVFAGSNYWLEVDVRTNGVGGYTVLSPLQAFLPTPYALFAEKAGTAVTAANVVTYTAGPGLLLVGSQFKANLGSNGVSALVSRDDHGHFGASWVGTTPGSGLTVNNLDPNTTYSAGITASDLSTYGFGVLGRQGTGSGFAPRPGGLAGDGDSWYGVTASSRSNIAIFADSYNADAIYGWAHAPNGGFGVEGVSDDWHGVVGTATAASGQVYGVYGNSSSTSGRGVYGYAPASSGTTYGVYGESASASGIGVYGANDTGGINTYGVYGHVTSVSGVGVYGVNASAGGSYGVRGEGQTGVYGLSAIASGNGIIGECNNGPSAYGVWGKSSSGFAGYFNGNVSVVGTLSKSAGSFKIDDPLDPTNKFLYHSFVESPDMKNIYDGLVTLDAQGAAIVSLPDWFGALNQDFRYQLTAVGAPAPQLYVAQEIQNNQFKIAGGTPGGKISWQVTGIRHDAYANAHRIPVVEDKPVAERGTYLHGKEYGLPQLTTARVGAAN